eukprot:jgi/Ulvmu1/2397/UM131_0009.1
MRPIKLQAEMLLQRIQTRPWAGVAMAVVPCIILVALFATSPLTMERWPSQQPRMAAERIDPAQGAGGGCGAEEGLPFVAPPEASAMDEYINCLLRPGIIAGNISGECTDYSGGRAQVEMLKSHAVVGLNYSGCAPLAKFPAGDDREELYEPTATYARQATTDGFALVQVLCEEFDYLKLVAPYAPRTRPLAILDAGANAGFASFLFARFMRFQGELVSVEMNPFSARMARRNTAALNAVPGMRSRVVHSALVSLDEAQEQPEMRFIGVADGRFLSNRLTAVGEYGPSDYSMIVPTTSLPQLLKDAQSDAFDFIKLDIEGAEYSILHDTASHAVLCKARCVFAELHERHKAGIEAAWLDFVATGCPEGRRMREIANTGEYSIVCREDL